MAAAFDRTCEGLKPDGPGAAIEALEAPQSPKGRPQLAFPCRRRGQALECEAGHLSLTSGRANLTSDR
jgi:hypothetical protein